jgi:predicted ferric reductase
MPGQYVFLNVPVLSAFQWHPLTLTSVPEEGFLSVHIRVVGDWTSDLQKLTAAMTHPNQLQVRVDGPYGAPAQCFYHYTTCIMIATGIGVTPMAALLKSAWYRYHRTKCTPRIVFIWITRSIEVTKKKQTACTNSRVLDARAIERMDVGVCVVPIAAQDNRVHHAHRHPAVCHGRAR